MANCELQNASYINFHLSEDSLPKAWERGPLARIFAVKNPCGRDARAPRRFAFQALHVSRKFVFCLHSFENRYNRQWLAIFSPSCKLWLAFLYIRGEALFCIFAGEELLL